MRCSQSLTQIQTRKQGNYERYRNLKRHGNHISCMSNASMLMSNVKVYDRQAQAPGFVRLQQLSCAMPVTDSPSIGSSGVPDNLLSR